MKPWLACRVALIMAPAALSTAMAADEPCRLPFREQFLTETLDRENWTTMRVTRRKESWRGRPPQ